MRRVYDQEEFITFNHIRDLQKTINKACVCVCMCYYVTLFVWMYVGVSMYFKGVCVCICVLIFGVVGFVWFKLHVIYYVYQ